MVDWFRYVVDYLYPLDDLFHVVEPIIQSLHNGYEDRLYTTNLVKKESINKKETPKSPYLNLIKHYKIHRTLKHKLKHKT